MTKRTAVVDTSALLDDPEILETLDDIVIPFAVVSELDVQKRRFDFVGINARKACREIDFACSNGDIVIGAKTKHGKTMRIVKTTSDDVVSLEQATCERHDDVDSLVLALALRLKKSSGVVVVTSDICMRIRASALGLVSVGPDVNASERNDVETYGGVSVVAISQNDVDSFHASGSLSVNMKLSPNQFVVAKSQSGSCLGKFSAKKKAIVRLGGCKQVFGLIARNKEQEFALDALLDEEIGLVTITGIAGSGKSLIALAAGVHQLLETKRHEKLVVMKPIQPLGNDIGYLPGTLKEKIEPWSTSVIDNLNYLFFSAESGKNEARSKQRRNDFLSILLDERKIEIDVITYVRGRSIPNSYIIVDEAQNLTVHELKTVITRVGERTKIVLTGDLKQIDNPHVNAQTCGLAHVIERFRQESIAAHIEFIKGERSALATLAAKIL